MKRLASSFIQFRFYIFSLVFFLIGWVPFFIENSEELTQQSLQERFSNLENEAKQTGLIIYEELLNGRKPSKKDSPFFIHIYQGDSLIYWNTNNLPISKYAQPQFPTNGRAQLQNGWYYATLKEDQRFKVCVSFLIKQNYSYSNSNLVNSVNPNLSNYNFDVGLQEEEGMVIRDANNNFIFSAVQTEEDSAWAPTNGLYIFSFLGLFMFLAGLYNVYYKHPWKSLIPFVILLSLRVLLSFYDLKELPGSQVSFIDESFGGGFFVESIFDLIINILLISLIALYCFAFLSRMKWRMMWLIMLFFLIFYWVVILELLQISVKHTSVPLDIQNIFGLNEYTFLLFFALGVLFYSLQHSFEWFTKRLFTDNPSSRIPLIISLISFIFFSLLRIIVYEEPIIAAAIPLFLLLAHIYFNARTEFSERLGFQLITLAFFTISIVLIINEHNENKDKGLRKAYAELLSEERNNYLESDFSTIRKKLATNPIVRSVAENNQAELSVSSFGDILEKKVFKGEWESYEIRFNLFDSSGISYLSKDSTILDQTKNIIDNHGVSVNEDSSLYFVPNEFNGISYVIQLPLTVVNKKVLFLATLKPKKIPEEIGFPRLLISDKSKALLSLENYSIAKYASGKLTKSYGPYSYEVNFKGGDNQKTTGEFYEKEGYSHYILDKGNNNAVVLSKKKSTWLSYSTSFSYVFSFWGVLLLFSYLLGLKKIPSITALSLAFKIQFVLVVLVVLALILFGAGSGLFVSNQYEDYTSKNINEKLNSVQEELKGKIALNQRLSMESDGNYLEAVLMKLSKVFVTDINIYDNYGYLVASSRQKLFNLGLLGEQINPDAFEALKYENKSFYKHNETIGSLSYISAYLPLYNSKGKLLGYANLQYFGQQKEYENQIQQFIVAIINVFIILIAISIMIALFVSNWLTSPLRLIKEKLANLQLANPNEKIDYKGNDEIGLIVKAYNTKLDELELAVKQLAFSERETAWREMAQQVAHEIKNPLTPMKLSIQQLMRTYDPTKPDMTERVRKMMTSLIEQVDGLTRIANEFSNFAKMPEPQRAKHDIVAIIKNCISVFQNETNIKFEFFSCESEIEVFIDKGQWIQVMNNLLNNAIQATGTAENGIIFTRLTINAEMLIIEVEDNGVGISDEIKDRIFIPHFTTKSTGSGIGLSVVKQIVQFHQADIEFESKVGAGTIFRISLPLNEIA
ncbi:MAG: HAMP domain-containing histidine kinase [Bacteroidetes bacterium]|nr:HAMP domain-containing histidine kinase [Bacteroidota bacterium]